MCEFEYYKHIIMCYCATVIFLVDVRVSFDEFKQSMIGICDQKTIITTNPGYQA